MDRTQDAKSRIIQAATSLIEEKTDVEKITVREIAQRADVGIGSISYHFGSKDALLHIAINHKTSRIAKEYLAKTKEALADPTQRLKAMLKRFFSLSQSQEKLARFMLLQEIVHGNMQTPLYLVFVLREIFGETKPELDLRILALQILQPLQIATISPAAFRLYSGVDMYDETARDQFIDLLVDHLIKKP